MIRRLWSNLSALVVALFLALLVWVVATNEENPIEDRTLPEPLAVAFANLPDNLVIVAATFTQTTPTLRAPHLLWETLGSAPISVTADLSALTPGTHDVPFTAMLTNQGVRLIKLEPAYLRLTVEALASKTIPIVLEQTGEPAPGYAAEAAILSSPIVTVTGPTSAVENAAECVVRLSIEGQKRALTSEQTLEPLGQNGQPVAGLALSPQTVQITVPITQKQGFREVAVKVVITGLVAAGYQVTNYTVSPQFITLSSNDPQRVNDMPGFVETQPLDISNATDDVIQRLALNLPDGVTPVGEQSALVQVNIAAIEYSLTIARNVTVQGLAPGLTAQVAPAQVDVLIFGPLPLLDKLTDEDVRVIVDVTNHTPGTYSLTPQVVLLSDKLRAENILPSQVEVVLSISTPTPTPTLTLTPPATKRP